MSDEEGINEKTSWWSKQSSGVKAAIGIVGICCLGLILIVGFGAMASPDKTTSTANQSTTQTTTTSQSSTPAAPAAPTPQIVTISQLYGNSIPAGTLVKVTGTVSQSDGYNLRIRNDDYKDIMVTGSGLTAYEDQKITIIGTYEGPTTYTTVMGGERTVPSIKDAKIA
ncbi:MAG: hypothetical protein HZC47_10275 [Methanobacterium sp.]|uniref:hypothetical protein n=1 Tax=Methanobacterium sp. TaxID=2164 RepID=UPI003D659A90|nr:hypothetical protein [Methanobacterium sp.]